MINWSSLGMILPTQLFFGKSYPEFWEPNTSKFPTVLGASGRKKKEKTFSSRACYVIPTDPQIWVHGFDHPASCCPEGAWKWQRFGGPNEMKRSFFGDFLVHCQLGICWCFDVFQLHGTSKNLPIAAVWKRGSFKAISILSWSYIALKNLCSASTVSLFLQVSISKMVLGHIGSCFSSLQN